MPWKEWLLDATLGVRDGLACFVPYESDTNEIVVGMNMLSSRAPGRLVGVIHADGQAAVDAWCAQHPDWHERFAPEDSPP